MNEQAHEIFHRLWTKATETESYDKKEWLRQAATALYGGQNSKLNRGDAIDLAEALLAEIEKREST